MLRFSIEIVPYGIEAHKRHILTMTIARSTAFEDPEDYYCHAYKDDGELVDRFWVRQHVRKDGAAELCRKALEVHCGIGRDESLVDMPSKPVVE